jgi:thiol-disulfide isomerase/thioredoxin
MKVIRPYPSLRATVAAALAIAFSLSAAGLFLSRPASLRAQEQKAVWSAQEKPIADQIGGLRSLPDNVRGNATEKLAIEIRQLPVTPNKLRLANSLAMLSTEGDFGHEMLQEVATTLATALREQPPPAKIGRPPQPYVELAELVRYEHVQATLDDPQFAAAVSKIEADNERRDQADFTLSELGGKTWTLKELHGKVVVLNFWATWCPPCRKEMPDLETLYQQFKEQGLVILAISDEDAGKVLPFIAQQKVT